MSRHEIPGITPGLEVVVGWDNPLQTFFAQVLRPGDEDDDILLWLGTTWEEHPTPESLVGPLAPYTQLDTVHLAELRQDQAETADEEQTDLQRHLQTVFSPRPPG